MSRRAAPRAKQMAGQGSALQICKSKTNAQVCEECRLSHRVFLRNSNFRSILSFVLLGFLNTCFLNSSASVLEHIDDKRFERAQNKFECYLVCKSTCEKAFVRVDQICFGSLNSIRTQTESRMSSVQFDLGMKGHPVRPFLLLLK